VAKPLTLPLDEAAVRDLRVGDDVVVSGRVFTARGRAQRWLASGEDPALRARTGGALVYHSSPVVSQDPASRAYRVVAAGPATSMREEPWQADVLARWGFRGAIGKGGMGARSLAALREHGAVYLHVASALAVVLARRVTRVHGVHLLDALGVAEAIWELELQDLPAIVTMDAHGNSLHAQVDAEAARIAQELMDRKAG
jgi:fumarate hydratase class I